MNKFYHSLFISLLSLTLWNPPAIKAQNSVQYALQLIVENGIENDGLKVEDTYLYGQDTIIKYYVLREYEPVWADPENRQAYLEIIEGSKDEGLIPEDYHLEKIKSLMNMGDAIDSYNEAQLDLLMSDGIILYAHHMNFGKVSQADLRGSWKVPDTPLPGNSVQLVLNALKTHQLKELSQKTGPQHFMYVQLKNGLKKYREIAAAGGWPQVPEGDVLKKEMTDERVAVMRERLRITGDLTATDPEDPNYFDDQLEEAVKNFQFRHNLNQDGVAGKKTIERMNLPVDVRIDMIRLNMERARWVMNELADDFLVVNIAGFNLRRVTNQEVVYYSPVIVGKKYHESPIFMATMKYFVINPTWTVPYSIATRETLPKLQKDPGYLDQQHMIIMDRSGKKLDPYSIDFSQYSRNNFPFTVRQEPGPHNALGEVKFIFPNPFNVYVHDTPARGLFAREERAFSHGCIRLQKKWELLLSLTDDPDEWNMDRINKILASGETTTVYLDKPIDILILYWTAGADLEDRIYFDEDVYNRDDAVLKALDSPWKFKAVVE
ncbi:MAG: L,D-transpeptidase family protein [bacterium]